MNRYAPAPYAERILRLALGVEPRDAVRGGRALLPRITVDEHPNPLHTWRRWAPGESLDDVLPTLDRHDSGRFARLLSASTRPLQRIRLTDPSRRYVARRVAVTIADEAAVIAAEDDPGVPDIGPTARIFRPSLHPGATYELSGSCLRGRITRLGRPVRWARVRAVVAGTDDLLGWAHADDRGEYVLPVANPAGQVGFATTPLSVALTVGFRQPDPVLPADDPLRALVDPLWDLIEESVTLPVAGDPAGTVADGRGFPPGYATHVLPPVAFTPGRVVDLDLP